MRSFFINNEKRLKTGYVTFLVFLAICWAIIGVFWLYKWVERNYIYPLKYEQEIIYYADLYGLERALVCAVVKTESSFNEQAQSNKGAKGLMQITDKTGEYIAGLLNNKDYNLFNAKDNLNFGCYYINKLIGYFNSVETAMIAFNAGEGNVRKWLKNSEYSVDGVTLINVPFNETKEYIKKIKQNFSKYKKLYRNILDKR